VVCHPLGPTNAAAKRLLIFPLCRALVLGSGRQEGAEEGGLRSGRARYAPPCCSLESLAQLLLPSRASHRDCPTEEGELS